MRKRLLHLTKEMGIRIQQDPIPGHLRAVGDRTHEAAGGSKLVMNSKMSVGINQEKKRNRAFGGGGQEKCAQNHEGFDPSKDAGDEGMARKSAYRHRNSVHSPCNQRHEAAPETPERQESQSHEPSPKEQPPAESQPSGDSQPLPSDTQPHPNDQPSSSAGPRVVNIFVFTSGYASVGGTDSRAASKTKFLLPLALTLRPHRIYSPRSSRDYQFHSKTKTGLLRGIGRVKADLEMDELISRFSALSLGDNDPLYEREFLVPKIIHRGKTSHETKRPM